MRRLAAHGRRVVGTALAVGLLATSGPGRDVGRGPADVLASLPVAAIGCTPSDTCVAVAAGVPDELAWSRRGGPWTRSAAPALRADGSHPLSIACSRLGCLLAGASGGRVATWTFDPRTHVVARSHWTLAGDGTSSVSCQAAGTCELLSLTQGTRTIGYLARSRDGGHDWFAQRPIVSRDGWDWTTSITNLTCRSLERCLVVGGSGGTLMGLGVARTSDGGRTWRTSVDTRLLPASMVACAGADVCFAVGWLDADPPYRLVVTVDDGASWRRLRAHASADTGVVACTTAGRCTTGGRPASGPWWFAARPTRSLADADVTPAVGCGTEWCAAATGSRVLEFRAG